MRPKIPIPMAAIAVVLAVAFAAEAGAQTPLTGDVLYRVTWLRAGPGRLQDLVAHMKAVASKRSGPSRPLVIRHSQGDQWDFMVLAPVDSYAAHFASADAASSRAPAELVAWQEDEFVRGPDVWKIEGFESARLFHVEMFNALAGKSPELIREREMENAYLAAVGRPVNAIFRRELGASWDVFTVGAYRDWRHYAERDLIAPERAAAAAKAAGFASDEAVGPYMRSLINTHHDTLATRVQ